MVDGQVDNGVYDKYLNEVMVFGDWVRHNQEGWLTEYGKAKYHEINTKNSQQERLSVPETEETSMERHDAKGSRQTCSSN